MTHLCIDLGLTHTGWARNHYDHGVIHIPARANLKPMDDVAKQHRLDWWMRRLNALLTGSPIDRVYVEGPFISQAHPTGAVETIRLHGVLAAVCAIQKRPLVVIENRTLKKAATGKGNASKQQMLDVANGLGADTTSQDEADAFLLEYCVAKGLV